MKTDEKPIYEGIMDYISKTPIGVFREPEKCSSAFKSSCGCKGTYYMKSSHSNFVEMSREHFFTPRNFSNYGMPRDASKETLQIARARFLIGYGLHSVRDFLTLRRDLYHISMPGSPIPLAKEQFEWVIPKDPNSPQGRIVEEALSAVNTLSDQLAQEWKTKGLTEDAFRWDIIRKFGPKIVDLERLLSDQFAKSTKLLDYEIGKAYHKDFLEGRLTKNDE